MKRLICLILGHDLEYTEKVIDHLSLRIEIERCGRCKEFSFIDVNEA